MITGAWLTTLWEIEVELFTGLVQPIGIELFFEVKVIVYNPKLENVTVATFPVPLDGVAPLEGLICHVITPGIPPIAVNVTLSPVPDCWLMAVEFTLSEVGGEHGFKPTEIGAELVCCTGAHVPSPIFTILNIAVYNPLLAKVILPVDVPEPELGLTPVEGIIIHCTDVFGVPPLILNEAVAPTFIAAELGLTVAALALGLAQGFIGASTKNRTLDMAELGSKHPAGTVLFVVVNNTWYSPATLNVIKPVLVPVPVFGDTPFDGILPKW
jgi:hypothetical protein